MQTIFTAYQHHSTVFSPWAQNLSLLFQRLLLVRIFFDSSLVKLENWEGTLQLFRDEYKVPLLSPEFAAYSAVFFELSCPVLLAIGLATRIAILPLLAMTAVIQFTYDQNIAHFFWAALLFNLLAYGAGRWSLDHFLNKKFRR
jgi:putative oxidoreductase